MTLILDSGGVSALASERGRIAEMRKRNQWPPWVPSIVLAEALTGDHRRDFHTNQLLRMCRVVEVTEQHGRDAALLRTRTGRASTIAATDAIVAAVAVGCRDPVVLTSDPDDLAALVEGHATTVGIASA